MDVKRIAAGAAVAVGVAGAGVASAGADARAANAANVKVAAVDGPQATDETFGDWTVSCREVAKVGRSCEAAQNFFLKGQRAPYGRVAIGRPKAAGDLFLTFMVPVNVNFEKPVAAGLDPAAGGALELKWTRCIPGACFATGPVTKGIVAKWSAAPKAPSAYYMNGANQKFTLGFSANGFKQAMAALLGG